MEVGGKVTVGENVMIGDGALGVRLPVTNMFISSSMQGIPLGISAATTAVVSIMASRQASIITSSRMTTISLGSKGFAATTSFVKSLDTPLMTADKPMISIAPIVFKFLTV
jgi:hypothetical protein